MRVMSGARGRAGKIPALFLLTAVLVFAPCGTPAESVVFGVLEWPPYVGGDLPGQGKIAERVRAICEAAGMDAEISFAPWKRVLLDAKSGRIDGVFPEYRSAAREKEYYFSVPIGCSLLGFVHRRETDLAWSRVADLARYRIGVVDGYVNSEEFDALVRAGRIPAEVGNSDILLLRMVAAGRIDAAVMDRDVFHHLLSQESLPLGAKGLVFDPHILKAHTLHVSFPRTPAGKALVERFDSASRALGLAGDCAPMPLQSH